MSEKKSEKENKRKEINREGKRGGRGGRKKEREREEERERDIRWGFFYEQENKSDSSLVHILRMRREIFQISKANGAEEAVPGKR